MTVYRFFVDIEVKKTNGDPELDVIKAGKMLSEFANGTVAELLIPESEIKTVAIGEVHTSTRDYACDHCIEMAQDGKN